MDGIDIPFNLASEKTDDSIYLSSNEAKIVNGYIDSSGRINRVPGYTVLTTIGTGKYINGLFGYRDETSYNTYYYNKVFDGGSGSLSFGNSSATIKSIDSVDVVWICSDSRYFGALFDNNVFNVVEVTNTSAYIRTEKCSKNNTLKFLRCKNALNSPDRYNSASISSYPEGVDFIVFSDGKNVPFIMSPALLLHYPSRDHYSSYRIFVKKIKDAEAPKPCSHIVFLDTYILGNNVTNGIFDISYSSYVDRWDGDFATAGYRADNIVALLEARHKLICFGAESIEIWVNDGSSPFSPEYNHINSGLLAPYSALSCDNVLYWLDAENRIMACDIAQGVVPTEISATLSKKINKSRYVSDCISSYARYRQERFYLADFPTQNKTFMVNTQSGMWSQLGHWNTRHNQYDAYGLLHHTYINSLGTLASGRTNDTIYRVGEQYHTFNGDEIRTLIRTPVINHNTTDSKTVSRIEVLLERTMDKDIAGITIDPMFMIRWRDDGRTNWQPWRRISIENLGRTSFFLEINRCGSYRTRQYEIVLLGDYPLCLTAMKEIHK
jgi:hypothetical protein